MEQLIAWLEEELKIKRDLIDLIENQNARFWLQEDGNPMLVDTTDKDLVNAKEKAAQIEAQLQRLSAA